MLATKSGSNRKKTWLLVWPPRTDGALNAVVPVNSLVPYNERKRVPRANLDAFLRFYQ